MVSAWLMSVLMWLSNINIDRGMPGNPVHSGMLQCSVDSCDHCRPVKLPWIFPGAPKVKGAPGNIQGHLTARPLVIPTSFQGSLWVPYTVPGSLRWCHSPCRYRADSRLAPSQWETLLQSNAVSHWLGAKPRISPKIFCLESEVLCKEIVKESKVPYGE